MPRIAGIDYSLSGDVLTGPITLLDNQGSPQTAVSYTASSNKYVQLQYSVDRNGQTRTGRMLIEHNGVIASLSDDNTDTSDVGVTFLAVVSGPNLVLQYLTTATGFNANLKFYQKKWN